jgi:hypothetical protein
MRKLIVWIGIALLMLALAAPGIAQEEAPEDWFVYLLDVNSYSLLRVNSDGSQTEFSLPLPANTFFGPSSSGFAAEGRFLVFCTTQFASAENPTPGWTAYVIDVFEGTVLRTFDIGQVSNCMANQFSEDASLIGVGLLNYFPGDPNADTSPPLWELQVYDVVSGEVVAELTADDPAAAGVELAEFGGPTDDHPIVPRFVQVSADSVVFQAYPGVGMGGPPEMNVYRWDIAANIVELLENRGSLVGDFIPETGEIVAPQHDPGLPSGEPGGPLPAYNILQLTDAEGNTETIYQNTEQIIVAATFVNDGEAIAVSLLDPFDPEQPTQHITVIMIDLEGNVLRTVGEFSGYVQTFTAPGGFILIHDIPQELTPPGFALQYHAADGTSTELWHYEPDEVGTFWQVLHVES